MNPNYERSELEVVAQHPRERTKPNPILFIHGAWHGAWSWERFLPYFAGHGYSAYALSLRGHGGSGGRAGMRWHSVARDYVADVAQVVATLPAPPILVGHSMGGFIVQKYLEARKVPAAVLLASIPARGIWGFALRYGRRHPWALLKAHLCLDPWPLIGTPVLAHELCFSPNLPSEEVARHFRRLGPESFMMVLETLGLALPRPRRVQTPLMVMAAANDRFFSVAEQEATARSYGVPLRVFPNMAHDMMLEPAWRDVADEILAWLAVRGL